MGRETNINQLDIKNPKNKLRKNYSGTVGFIITLGVLIEQVWAHTNDWFQYYMQMPFSGGLIQFLNSTDPLDTLFFKSTYIFGLTKYLFFFIYVPIVLIFFLLRKKNTPKLLVIFAGAAGILNTVYMILLNLQSEQLKPLLFIDNWRTIAYVAIDIVLYLYYLKAENFKKIFNK